MYRLISLLSLLLLTPQLSMAQQPDSLLECNRLKYTKERPLIYEDAQDLWPYSFLDDNGEPEGYNVELIKMILDKLNIPYEIKMKPRLMAFSDLREGRSDLMIGLVACFPDEFAHCSKNPVLLFTQSVLSPRSNPTTIKTFHDLATHQVIVGDSSFCHRLMIDNGWGGNAMPTHDIAETIVQMSTDEKGQLVWDTMSLKWLLIKFQITNLEVTPVDIPLGDYKFISGDEHLIHLIDSIFPEMIAKEKTVQLEWKWFYPERQETRKDWPKWAKRGAVVLAVIMFILFVYIIVYQIKARRITRVNNRLAKHLALTLETSGVRIWTYNVPTKTFSWRDNDGKVAYRYSAEEFLLRYPPEDAEQLMQAIAQLSKLHDSYTPDELRLTLKARDNEDGDNTLHNFTIRLSVLQRDKTGRPMTLIATKVDITEKLHEQRLTDERTMRFNAIFNTPLVSILYFDADGILIDLNDKACQTMNCLRQDILADKVKLKHLFDTGDMTPEQMDGYHATLFVDLNSLIPGQHNIPLRKSKQVLCDEFTLSTVYDDSHNVIGIFAVCRSVSHIREGVHQQAELESRVSDLKQQLAGSQHDIDNVLNKSDVRLAVYSTVTHTLQIYRSTNEVQHTISQTRCMDIADNRSQKLVMRTLATMDSCTDRDIDADVLTKLRIKGGQQLALHFRLAPQKDKKGQVIAYKGLCRNLGKRMGTILQVCSVIIAFCCLTVTNAGASEWSDKYNQDRPLVIVGDWNKPPYEFLNDEGEPFGMNVDLMRMLCSQFHIPYKFVLKEWSVALKTFERGDADIILVNVNRYKNSEFAYSKNVINYNRICAATCSEDSIRSVTTSTLLKEGVVLKNGDYTGIFLRNLDSLQTERIDYQSPEAALHGLLADDYQYFCWGEEPLKWKIRELNLKGITLCDVDIPVSEVHIVGRDKELIYHLDDVYSRLKQNGEVQRINDQWLHPKKVRKRQMPRIILEGIIAIILTALLYVLAKLAIIHLRRATQTSVELNGMTQKAHDMGSFHIEANEKTINELGRKFERLSNTPFLAMSFYDREGWLIDINDKMKEICGITPDNPDAERFWMSVNLFSIPLFRDIYKSGTKEGLQAGMYMKYNNINIDRCVEYYVQPLLDAEGQVVNYYITTIDLTYERNMHKRLMNLRHEQQDTTRQIELQKQWLTFLLQNSDESPTT